eukprot:scaffold447005_cov122-Attheya_sp.AAC.1
MALINIDNLEDAVGSIYDVKHIDTRTTFLDVSLVDSQPSFRLACPIIVAYKILLSVSEIEPKMSYYPVRPHECNLLIIDSF